MRTGTSMTMTDTDRINFIANWRPDIGYRDGEYSILVWGENRVVAQAQSHNFREALDTAFLKVRRLPQRTES